LSFNLFFDRIYQKHEKYCQKIEEIMQKIKKTLKQSTIIKLNKQ